MFYVFYLTILIKISSFLVFLCARVFTMKSSLITCMNNNNNDDDGDDDCDNDDDN